MTSYRGPRRLNAVTVTLLLLLAAGAYWLWRYFPAYFAAWTVDHALREAAASVYKISRMQEPLRTQELRDLVERTRKDIVQKAAITDPDLEVSVEMGENEASVLARYTVVVTHPGTKRTSTLHFVRKQSANIKKVRWD